MKGRHYWSVSFPQNIPTILSRSSLLTEYGASWTIPTVTSDRMISACVISYQRWPVQLCWSAISGQVCLFWPVIAPLFTLNISSMLHWWTWEHEHIYCTVHAYLSACFRTHMRECTANVTAVIGQIFENAL